MQDPTSPDLLLPSDLRPYHQAIQLIYDAAHYVGKVAYAGGDEFLFKVALESELKIRFQQWSVTHQRPSPFLQTEAVLSYQYPASAVSIDRSEKEEMTECLPPCTHLRADIWIYSCVPDFPSLVIELKSVDKMQSKHRRQAHQYFCIMKRIVKSAAFQPKFALVINFRGFYCKELTSQTALETTLTANENENESVNATTTTTKRKRKLKEENEEITEVFFAACDYLATQQNSITTAKLADVDNSEGSIQVAAGVWTPLTNEHDQANHLQESMELMKWYGIKYLL